MLPSFAWRIALLLLPWQIALAFSNGFFVYASWPFLILTILLAVIRPVVRTSPLRPDVRVLLALLLLALVSLVTPVPVLTIQWWVQILLLAGFGWALIRLDVSLEALMTWGIIACVPHAVLAIQQGMMQQVIGMSWLGIPALHPSTAGVSVVDTGGVRYLRAYGGMSYPNLLGGWLAFAFPASLWMAVRRRSVVWSTLSVVFVAALLLTYSRSAWIACVLILIALGWRFHSALRARTIALRFLPILCVAIVIIVWQWPLFVARTTAHGPLEDHSLMERVNGMQDGWEVFQERWLAGSGLNTFAATWSEYALPHNVPILVLAEVGMLGAITICVLLVIYVQAIIRQRRISAWTVIPPLLVLVLLDHYAWSYWHGQALVALALIVPLLDRSQTPSGNGRA